MQSKAKTEYFFDLDSELVSETVSQTGEDLDFGPRAVKLDHETGKRLWEGTLKGHPIKVVDGKPTLGPIPSDHIGAQRRREYSAVSDPLLMKFLRGKYADDPGMAEVMQKVEEIKARHPKEDGA